MSQIKQTGRQSLQLSMLCRFLKFLQDCCSYDLPEKDDDVPQLCLTYANAPAQHEFRCAARSLQCELLKLKIAKKP